MVAVSTPRKESAFIIFSVMNSRGMDLLPIDTLKADIIGLIKEDKRSEYSEKWEHIEQRLTPIGLNEMATHLRMIRSKTKADKSLIKEFKEVFSSEIKTDEDAMKFIDEILEPYSDAYMCIKSNTIGTSDVQEKDDESNANEILKWLNELDNSNWIPVAMFFYMKIIDIKSKSKDKLMYHFLKKLERLAVYMRITSSYEPERIQRYSSILKDIESFQGEDGNFGQHIELSEDEIREFIERLNSDVYNMTPVVRKYLVLRLDSFIGDGCATYTRKRFTLEHVLPQNIKSGSQWEKDWPEERTRRIWLHKICNLIPLNKKHNSSAQNYNFSEKKRKYFTNKEGVSTYALCTEVLTYETWTPRDVEERQKKLLDIYIKNWELEIPKTENH